MKTYEVLREEVIEKYGSIHAFCKAFPHLKRATIYMTLANKYAGKVSRQFELIKAALSNEDAPKKAVKISENEIQDVLQNHKCLHCRLLNKNNCVDCKMKTEKEANTVFSFICGRI